MTIECWSCFYNGVVQVVDYFGARSVSERDAKIIGKPPLTSCLSWLEHGEFCSLLYRRLGLLSNNVRASKDEHLGSQASC